MTPPPVRTRMEMKMCASFWDSWDRHGSPASHSPQLSLHIGSPCLYCDEPIDVPTRDRIYPRVLGGRSDKKNIVIVCQKCNQDKGDLPLF
jgi:5-methylcytosine-specific restriction endonuclease McrA